MVNAESRSIKQQYNKTIVLDSEPVQPVLRGTTLSVRAAGDGRRRRRVPGPEIVFSVQCGPPAASRRAVAHWHCTRLTNEPYASAPSAVDASLAAWPSYCAESCGRVRRCARYAGTQTTCDVNQFLNGRRSAGGGRRAAVGGRRAAGGGRRAAGGGRRSAVGGRRSAGGGRRAAGGGRRRGCSSRTYDFVLPLHSFTREFTVLIYEPISEAAG
ncbi:unnamed protein product [Spodoptera littoralis]|uniref:Uncharacterized protein n=1 Tax=Spodoptera littoralis TaxID=7109 RepID=A0A9N8KZG7_SPOLI|nr:unnamed protein product [Spodoptera littoralis]CAD0239336.1 unnamed protein product [Spodoptera littoralis]